MNAFPSASPGPVTRRSVLAWTGAGLSAALAGTLPGPGAAWAEEVPGGCGDAGPAVLPGREHFARLLGSDFELRTGENPEIIRCRLTQAGPLVSSGPGNGRQFASYSLVFTGPAPLPAESRIWQVRHPDLGSLELFLSPIGFRKPGGSCHLEAVCSQQVAGGGAAA